jgi:hypothetical protein
MIVRPLTGFGTSKVMPVFLSHKLARHTVSLIGQSILVGVSRRLITVASNGVAPLGLQTVAQAVAVKERPF